MSRVPDFFIVGQPKTGTTALHAMLSRHPQIYMPELKEPYFLADELADDPPPAALPTTLSEYLALFTPAAPGQLTGEATVFYLWSATAARNIARLRPDARIIAVLREPASFLHSLHLHFVKHNMETEKDLRRALALDPARRTGQYLPHGGYWPQLLAYSEHTRYMDQLRRYRDLFPENRLLVMLYDDFRADNRATIRRILNFLKVDANIPLAEIEANQSARVRSRRAAGMLDAVSEGRGPGLSVVKTAVETLTSQRVRRGAKGIISRHVVYAKPRTPDSELMAELRARFLPEVRALAKYLDRDLMTLWGYDGLE